MSSTKIAFGSCVRYKRFGEGEQLVWDEISKHDPDHLILLGDQVYMDYGIWPFTNEPIGKPAKYSEKKFAKVMRSKYEQQWSVTSFKNLRTKMLAKDLGLHATRDDHDFAWNNAKGADVKPEIKEISLNLFNEFIYGKASLEKVYKSFTIKDQAKVIILDNRQYSEKMGKNASLLGAEQLGWLDEQIKSNTLPYTIICGSLPLTRGSESWVKYPKEYKKFCNMVRGKKGLIYLSGDIHNNKFDKPGYRRAFPNVFKKIEHPCFEATSSGIANTLIGLPFTFDERQNWGMLELDDSGMTIKLHKNVNQASTYNIPR